MNRLEKKGFIQSRLGGATELRGGRRKRLFTITAYGKKVLQKSRDVKVNLWNQIPELALNQFDSLQMKHQNPIPPKSAEHFLSRFCKDELLEEILGDLQEYYDELAWQPRWKRNLFYWFPSSFVISLQSAEG
ncbi:MAG: PadR family transcriptional regulator [Cytophagales bacterium]|nr:PadR family transcriptional regulator [Cytophagales bacterium]